jgi:hypothetical protein
VKGKRDKKKIYCGCVCLERITGGVRGIYGTVLWVPWIEVALLSPG